MVKFAAVAVLRVERTPPDGCMTVRSKCTCRLHNHRASRWRRSDREDAFDSYYHLTLITVLVTDHRPSLPLLDPALNDLV